MSPVGCVLSLWLSLGGAVSVSDLARYAEYEDAVISPDGTYLAITRRVDSVQLLNVLRVADMASVAALSGGRDTEVGRIVWATDERLLIEPMIRYGAEDFAWPSGEILGINADGTRREVLFGFRAGRRQTGTHIPQRESERASASIIDVLPDDPDHVLIESRPWSQRGQSTAAYRMDVFTGHLSHIARTPNTEGGLLADGRGGVAASFGITREMQQEIYVAAGATFRRVKQLPPGQSILPLGIAPGEQRFYVAENTTAPTAGLAIWQAGDDTLEPIWRNSRVDMNDIWKTWDGRRLVLVRYVDHYIHYFYPNPEDRIAVMHKRLRATFPKDDVAIISATRDDRLVVAHVSGDRNPGRFIVVDTNAMKATHSLATRPWLDGKDLAEMTPISLSVRDGKTIDGYLSLPPNGPQENLPLVVLVHGGPAVQDVWGFDPEVQILATQGYAVLQVNFRGSSGFGREFQAASARRWGLEMQDDVTDATRWAIAERIADPSRICIYGASYGAYAALTGAWREPGLYRCAIGYAGVFDLTLFDTSGDVPRRWFGRTFVASEIGTDEADLRARSPVNHAAEIKAGVLLIHGGLDQRAPPEHAKRMRAALKRAGNEPEWLYEPDEGHGFFGEKNRIRVYEKILGFLDRHIGSRTNEDSKGQS